MVTLEHVGKRYAAGPPVLSDVSLALETGGFYFLTGPGGAGKTTLLKIVHLAERPTSGRVILFGSDTGRLDRRGLVQLRRRIGFLFQDLRLVDDLSAADNIALPLRIAGAPEREIDGNVAELLAWLGLENRGNAPISALSGRERQRVALARAIIARPRLLLADEPTGNADEAAALQLVQVLERINQLGTTVLVATHDIAFAGRFDHRIVHLEDGRILADPSTEAL